MSYVVKWKGSDVIGGEVEGIRCHRWWSGRDQMS